MAKKALVDSIIKIYSELGGNLSNVLGKRSNITFLGKGKTPEGFIDSDINIDAIGVLGKSKVLDELESPMGYLTSDKLNDVQAGKLKENLLKIKEVFDPPQIPNITDMATGTRDLTQEGLGSLRTGSRQMTPDELADFEIQMGDRLEAYDFDGTIKDAQRILTDDKAYTDEMFAQYKAGKLDPQPGEANREKFLRGKFEEMEASGDKRLMTRDEIEELSAFDDLPPPGSRGGPDDIAAPFQSADETISNLREMPAKRASAREFLVEALKRDETDVVTAAFGKTNLNNIIDAEDVKYITEGGGGIGGDPIVLVEKYFGPRIAEALPSGASNEEILIFTKRVLENVEDAAGLKPDNPRFDRFTARFIDEVQEFAKGGRVAFQGGGMDASQDDFNPPSETSTNNDPPDVGGGGDDKKFNTPLIEVNPVYQKDNYLEFVPTKVGLEALLADKGRLQAVLDTEESLKEGELIGDMQFQGALDTPFGPVNLDAYADFDGQKGLSANYNKDGLNLGGAFDSDGNKNISFGYDTPSGGKITADTDLDDNFNVFYSKTFAKGGRVGLRFGRAAGKAFGLFKKQQALKRGLTRGYADMRKYGIEGEDITNMFKQISMDSSLVGPEKTEYFKVLNQALKNPNQFPDTIKEIQMKLGIEVGTGFKSGGLAKILEV